MNAEYASGMGSSFRTAVEHLPDSEAAMFALADQPFVTTNEYRTVLDTYRQHAPAIVSVRYGEVMAPPHLFEREFFPELAQLAARRPFGARAAPRPDDGPAVSAGSVDGYRHARGLRACAEGSRLGVARGR